MIKIFKATDKDFTSNGDVVVKATRAVVHKVDNGDFFLEIEAPIDYVDYFAPRNIIVADTPQGEQAFRLEANIETTRTKIKAKARHVYYDGLNLLIADSYVVNKTCDGALNHLNDATDELSPFTVSSDITKIASYRCVRTSLTEAVNTVLERWGGHLVRDNFSFQIKETIGKDLGVTIQYRKNLKNITKTENWDAVCTKLLPVGKDGVLLDNLYLWSEVQYDLPFTKTVSFSQDINQEDYETEEEYIAALKEDLEEQGRAYLKVSQYPSINYTVTANVEQITDVGDVVAVYDERLGIELIARVLSYDYNVVLGQYAQVEFGTANPSLSELMTNVNNAIDKSVKNSSQTITDYVNVEIESLGEDLTEYINEKVAEVPAEVIEQIDSYLYFKTGETLSLSNIIENGYIDSTSKIIKFTVPLHKDTNGKTASLTSLKLNGFSIDGDVFGAYSSSGHDILADSDYSVSVATKKNAITITLTKSAALAITGSTPLSIEVADIGISFG